MEKISENSYFYIFLVLVAAVLGAFAQYFFKVGSVKILEIPIYKNYYFISGLISFFWVLVLITISFRLGGPLMVVYPLYATTYIWSLLIARFLLKEQINLYQVTGVFLMIVGIALVSNKN